MRQRFPSITGFVLAGGASQRMGQDKSKLLVAGEALLQRQIRLLHSVCRSVAVLGPPQSFAGLEVPVFPDERPGRGPLGGLYTGLLQTRTEFNLFLGCDLPFMEASFLRYLCRRALERQADVTVPESRHHEFEPLCAVYRRRALGAVRRSLDSGENKVTRFFSRVRCEMIPWPEVSRAGFSPRIFVNMNTPQDYEEAKRLVFVRSRH
jgi:molybdopterin-guanine dinucleotide biosynthesis protein A